MRSPLLNVRRPPARYLENLVVDREGLNQYYFAAGGAAGAAAFLMASEAESNFPVIDVPSVDTAVIATTAINETSSAYSTIEAPRSDRASVFVTISSFFITTLFVKVS